MTYKNNEIKQTAITTTVTRNAFGREYQKNVYVYEIIGEKGKPAGVRPFLTSIEQCKNYINK